MIGKIQDIVTAAVVTAAVGNNTQNTVDNGTEQAAAQASAADASQQNAVVQNAQNTDAQNGKQKDSKQKKDKMDEKAVNEMTKELNKLMSKINCDLEFQYHKEVNVMSVKMIDKATQEVIKECPPEDMIKGMIRAREWIGAFLDKNA